MPSHSVEVSIPYEFYDISIRGLKNSTDYTIWVIGANAHPGNPDLMEDRFIVSIETKTDEPPVVEVLDLQSSRIMPLARILILYAVYLVFFDGNRD